MPIFLIMINSLLAALTMGFEDKMQACGEELSKVRNKLQYWEVDCPYDNGFTNGIVILFYNFSLLFFLTLLYSIFYIGLFSLYFLSNYSTTSIGSS